MWGKEYRLELGKEMDPGNLELRCMFTHLVRDEASVRRKLSAKPWPMSLQERKAD